MRLLVKVVLLLLAVENTSSLLSHRLSLRATRDVRTCPKRLGLQQQQQQQQQNGALMVTSSTGLDEPKSLSVESSQSQRAPLSVVPTCHGARYCIVAREDVSVDECVVFIREFGTRFVASGNVPPLLSDVVYVTASETGKVLGFLAMSQLLVESSSSIASSSSSSSSSRRESGRKILARLRINTDLLGGGAERGGEGEEKLPSSLRTEGLRQFALSQSQTAAIDPAGFLTHEYSADSRDANTAAAAAARAAVGESVASNAQEHPKQGQEEERAALGLGGSYFGVPFWKVVRGRSLWLVSLLLLQSVSSVILGKFEALLQRHLVLALFLTMLTGTAGNAGNQASASVICGLRTGELEFSSNGLRVLRREAKAASVSGFLLALASFARVATTKGGSALTGLAVALAMYATVVGAVLIGTTAPFLLEALGIDPTNGSSPALATLTDIAGVLVLCSISSKILGM